MDDAAVTDETVADVKATATAPEQTADEPKRLNRNRRKLTPMRLSKSFRNESERNSPKRTATSSSWKKRLTKSSSLSPANQSRNCPTRIKLKRIQMRKTSESRNSRHRLRTAKRLTRQIRFFVIPACRSRLTFSASLFRTTLIRHTQMSRPLSITRNRSRIPCVRNSARGTHRVCPVKRSEK